MSALSEAAVHAQRRKGAAASDLWVPYDASPTDSEVRVELGQHRVAQVLIAAARVSESFPGRV